jgi:hypothetical protein
MRKVNNDDMPVLILKSFEELLEWLWLFPSCDMDIEVPF